MEFTFNNASSIITDIFLFFANKGYYLNIIVHSEYNMAFSYAYNFAVNLNKLQNVLKFEIFVA